MPDVISISKELMSYTDIIAAAIIRQTCPVKDEMSERQAQRMFGSRWLMARKDDGSAEYHCSAGKNIYSRHQLMCLKEAERTVSSQLKIKAYGKD